jgi:L,D-transpeptidase catalytic domain
MIRNALSPLKILFRKECRFESDRRYHHSQNAITQSPKSRKGMQTNLKLRTCLLALYLFAASGVLAVAATLDAVTFAVEPGQIYVPVESAVKRLRWSVETSRNGTLTKLNGISVKVRLINNTQWVGLDSLATAGATVSAGTDMARYDVQAGRRGFSATIKPKRIEVDLSRQRLNAWQGPTLVLDTNISSGRYGNTPAGNFTAGPYKNRMHYSSKYQNAPMPWSVQITGHIFFHGFASVPNYPASHGCIRVPLSGSNPARFLYEWVDVGTPIAITRGPAEEIRKALPAN